MCNFAAFGAVSTIPILFQQRQVFYSEKDSIAYTSFPYVLSLVSVELLVSFFETLLFTITSYPIAGLKGQIFGNAWWFLFGLIYILYLCSYEHHAKGSQKRIPDKKSYCTSVSNILCKSLSSNV